MYMGMLVIETLASAPRGTSATTLTPSPIKSIPQGKYPGESRAPIFQMINRQFGFAMVRYRGLKRNTA
jgi:hypothetical protein